MPIAKFEDTPLSGLPVGQPNGIASLDGTGNVPASQLGNVALSTYSFYWLAVPTFEVGSPPVPVPNYMNVTSSLGGAGSPNMTRGGGTTDEYPGVPDQGIRIVTQAVLNDVAYYAQVTNNLWFQRNSQSLCKMRFRTGPLASDIQDVTIFVGVADTNLAWDLDTPQAVYGIRFNPSESANWRAVSGNALSFTYVDTGVAVASNTLYEAEFDLFPYPNVEVSVNGSAPVTMTATLPPDTAQGYHRMAVKTLVGSAKKMCVGEVYHQWLTIS